MKKGNNESVIIKEHVNPICERAGILVVGTLDERVAAVEVVSRLEGVKMELEERFHFTGNKEVAHKSYKAALETEKRIYGPLDHAREIVRGKIKAYDLRVAEKKAAEYEAAKRAAEEAKQAEEARLAKLAEQAEKKGRKEEAEELWKEAQNVVVEPVAEAREAKKLVWKARVVNVRLACRAIASGELPVSLVEFRQSGLNELGKSYDGEIRIQGIEFYRDVTTRL
jgi:hypothetical protein